MGPGIEKGGGGLALPVFSKLLNYCFMGTCNFSKVNARRYYVVDDRIYYNQDEECWQDEPIEGAEVSYIDSSEIIDNLQQAALWRPDGKRFTCVEERETGWKHHRDEGTVILEYDGGRLLLPDGYFLDVVGKIILRPGYYEAATLDWDFNLSCGCDFHVEMNDCEDLEDVYEAILDDWLNYYENDWNAGIKKMQAGNFRKKLEGALDGVVDKLEEICAGLVGPNIYQCDGHFSNGEAIYSKVQDVA